MIYLGFKNDLKRKILLLMKKLTIAHESMSWKDELRAAKTLEIYVRMYDE